MYFLSWHQQLADATILLPPFKLNSVFCAATWNHFSKKERLCEMLVKTSIWWKSWRMVWIWVKEIVCFGEVSYQINIEQLKNRKKNLHNATFILFFSPSTKKQEKYWQPEQYFNVVLHAALWHITFLESNISKGCNDSKL